MWIVAHYRASSLFTLKPSIATSSGGRTLLVPTAFAIKMALLDAAIRTQGIGMGRMLFDEIRDLGVAVRPTERAVVTNLFSKVLKPERGDKDEARTKAIAEEGSSGQRRGGRDVTLMQRSIAYREYAQLAGILGVALQMSSGASAWLDELIVQISYLGKRGSFLQLVHGPVESEELPEGFVPIDGRQTHFDANGLVQMLDDCGKGLTFERADVFNQESLRLGRDRVVHTVVLPYRVVRSSNRYTEYELMP